MTTTKRKTIKRRKPAAPKEQVVRPRTCVHCLGPAVVERNREERQTWWYVLCADDTCPLAESVWAPTKTEAILKWNREQDRD